MNWQMWFKLLVLKTYIRGLPVYILESTRTRPNEHLMEKEKKENQVVLIVNHIQNVLSLSLIVEHPWHIFQIFFFIMFLTTCKTSKLYEARNAWHSRWWALKFVILIFALVISFFVPSDFIQLYGKSYWGSTKRPFNLNSTFSLFNLLSSIWY